MIIPKTILRPYQLIVPSKSQKHCRKLYKIGPKLLFLETLSFVNIGKDKQSVAMLTSSKTGDLTEQFARTGQVIVDKLILLTKMRTQW